MEKAMFVTLKSSRASLTTGNPEHLLRNTTSAFICSHGSIEDSKASLENVYHLLISYILLQFFRVFVVCVEIDL
jgi:hypothetical protein